MAWEKLIRLLPKTLNNTRYQASVYEFIKCNNLKRATELPIPKAAISERSDEKINLKKSKPMHTINETLTLKIPSLYDSSTLTENTRIVKPHVPLITFPKRNIKTFKYNTIRDVKEELSLSCAPKNLSSRAMKPSASIPNGPTLESSQLPLRYKRQPLTIDEMEYIEKGGPV